MTTYPRLVIQTLKYFLLAAFMAFASVAVSASETQDQQPKPSTGAPEWLPEYFNFFTRDGGCWVASNAAYKSEQETTDSYVVEWQYAIDNNGKRARLYGINAGEQSDDYWAMHVYWDGSSQSLRIDQFGRHSIVGHGVLVRSTENVIEQEMQFALADGRTWKDKHVIELFEDEHKTTSYDWQDEQWIEKRSYTWQRCKM